YQRYLDHADPPADRRAEVVKILADLDARLGFVTVTINPAQGAELRLAAADWMPADAVARWRVSPGDVVIVARGPDSADATKTVHVDAGATVAVAIELLPSTHEMGVQLPPPPPPPPPVAKPASHVLGVSARALVDGKVRGAAGALGAVAALGPVGLEAGAILGPTFGGYAGASLAFTHARVRPRVAASLPFYVSDGARLATRLAAGADWRIGARISALVE